MADDMKKPEVWQVVSIVTCMLLITTCLATVTRLATKYAMYRRLRLDDLFATIAMLCYIGSATSVLTGARDGLGQPVATISPDRLSLFEKNLFAAELLFIATVYFAKLSIVFLVNSLTVQRSHRRLGLLLGCFTTAWSVACFLTAAFACAIPETWNVSSHCHNRAAFWYAYGSINIAIDVAFVLLLAYITIPLQMNVTTKLMILSCFCSRLCDVIATAIQLVYTNSFLSPDPTLELWPWILTSQIVQCITIITSCIPYLKPLLVSFPSGLFMSDEIRRKGTSKSDRTRKFALRSVQSSEKDNSDEPSPSMDPFSRSNSGRFTRASATTTITATGGENSHMVGPVDLSDPQNATLIMKSTTFSVSHVPAA